MSAKKEREIKPAPKREREEAAASGTSAINKTVGVASSTTSDISDDENYKKARKVLETKLEAAERKRLKAEQMQRLWENTNQADLSSNPQNNVEPDEAEKPFIETKEPKETPDSLQKKRKREGEKAEENGEDSRTETEPLHGSDPKKPKDAAGKQKKAEQVVSAEANATPEKKSDTSNLNFNNLPSALAGHIAKFLPYNDVIRLTQTNKQMKKFIADNKVWRALIETELKRKLPNLPYMVADSIIYMQLKVYNSLSLSERNTYSEDDPALFQSQLPEGTSLAFRTYCFSKAARVGNLALVKWLVSPERGAMRVYASRSTLNAALQSGNLELVQWLESVERGDQRVCFNKFSLNKAMEGKSSPAVIKMLLKQNISWVKESNQDVNDAAIEAVIEMPEPLTLGMLEGSYKNLEKVKKEYDRTFVSWVFSFGDRELLNDILYEFPLEMFSDVWRFRDQAVINGNLVAMYHCLQSKISIDHFHQRPSYYLQLAAKTNRDIFNLLLSKINVEQIYTLPVQEKIELFVLLVEKQRLEIVKYLKTRPSLTGESFLSKDDLFHAKIQTTKIDFKEIQASVSDIEKAGVKITDETLLAAIKSGVEERMDWVLQRGLLVSISLPTMRKIIDAAISSGNADYLKKVIEAVSPLCPEWSGFTAENLNVAIDQCNLPMVEYLVEKAPEGKQIATLPEDALERAVRLNHLPLVRYFIVEAPEGKRLHLTRQILTLAVEFGCLPLVQYLVEVAPGLMLPNDILDLAADCNHLSIVQWLILKAPEGAVPNRGTIEQVMEVMGNYKDVTICEDVLEWLALYAPASVKVKPSLQDGISAVREGQVKLLRWLIIEAKKGLLITPDKEMLWAALEDVYIDEREDVLHFLGVELPPSLQIRATLTDLRRMIEEGGLEAIQILVPYPSSDARLAELWLHPDEESLQLAFCRGDLNIIKYLTFDAQEDFCIHPTHKTLNWLIEKIDGYPHEDENIATNTHEALEAELMKQKDWSAWLENEDGPSDDDVEESKTVEASADHVREQREKLYRSLLWLISDAPEGVKIRPTAKMVASVKHKRLRELLIPHVRKLGEKAEEKAKVTRASSNSSSSISVRLLDLPSSAKTPAPPLEPGVTSALSSWVGFLSVQPGSHESQASNSNDGGLDMDGGDNEFQGSDSNLGDTELDLDKEFGAMEVDSNADLNTGSSSSSSSAPQPPPSSPRSGR